MTPRSLAAGALLALCVAAPPGRAADPAIAAPPGARLPPLLELLDQGSPELRALAADVDAARERVHHAEALPDPRLSIELRDIRSRDPNLSPSQVGSTRYQIRQEIPLWGKRDLRRDVAQATARQLDLRRGGTRNELRSAVKVAFNQYLAAARIRHLNRELHGLLGNIGELARARYATGLTGQQDAIRALAEQTQIAADLLAVEAEERQAAARLNALLARPAGAPLAEPEVLPALPARTLELAPLRDRALAANPEIGARNAELAAARSNEALVRRERYPDLAVGVAPVQSGTRFDRWDLMFEMTIPLQQETRRSSEREAAAMQRAAEARRAAAMSDLVGELGQSWAGYESASQRQALLRGSLLPQAEIAFESALAGYRDGKLDFATLLDAQRQIRRTRIDLIRVEAEQRMRLAEIERLIGDDL